MSETNELVNKIINSNGIITVDKIVRTIHDYKPSDKHYVNINHRYNYAKYNLITAESIIYQTCQGDMGKIMHFISTLDMYTFSLYRNKYVICDKVEEIQKLWEYLKNKSYDNVIFWRDQLMIKIENRFTYIFIIPAKIINLSKILLEIGDIRAQFCINKSHIICTEKYHICESNSICFVDESQHFIYHDNENGDNYHMYIMYNNPKLIKYLCGYDADTKIPFISNMPTLFDNNEEVNQNTSMSLFDIYHYIQSINKPYAKVCCNFDRNGSFLDMTDICNYDLFHRMAKMTIMDIVTGIVAANRIMGNGISLLDPIDTENIDEKIRTRFEYYAAMQKKIPFIIYEITGFQAFSDDADVPDILS